MMKRIFLILITSCLYLSANAQQSDSLPALTDSLRTKYIPITQQFKEHNIFQHLDASLTLGTTGIGFDVSSPITDWAQVRAGFSFMPHFHPMMRFEVQVGDNPSESAMKFQNLSKALQEMTGYQVNNSVDMIGEPTYYNFNLLFDVFPFRQNKHWHFTAGFYWGNSKIAKAYNTTEDMPSLVAVGIYNNMYEKAIRREPFIVVNMNGGTYVYTEDVELQDTYYEKFSQYGRMGVRLGEYVSDGTPYIIEPDENSMVKAEVMANSFKPYLGFGYGGRLFKGNDKYKISFDCGALFWGGAPSIIAHDGTDLAKDVKIVNGKTRDYVEFIKNFKVFPIINLRITRSLF